MKRMKTAAVLLLSLLMLFCCTSCNGKDATDAGAAAPPAEENKGEAVVESTAAQGSQKLIITANFTIETTTFDDTVASLQAATAAAGGYVEDSKVNPRQNDGTRGYAEFTLRIPAAQTEAFSATLSGLGNVLSKSQSATDVTLAYSDLDARIENLRAEKARVTELFEQASDVSESLRIQERLGDITVELSSLERQLAVMGNQVTYSTFHVSLQDVVQLSEGESENYLQELGVAVKESLSSFISFLGGLLIAVIYLLPFALLVFLIVFLIRRSIVRRRKKAQAKKDFEML